MTAQPGSRRPRPASTTKKAKSKNRPGQAVGVSTETQSSAPSSTAVEKGRATVQNYLLLGRLRAEKCDLTESRLAFEAALAQARKIRDTRLQMEAIAGMLRLSSEALDHVAIRKWDGELDKMIQAHPKDIPAMAWYCKAIVAMNLASGSADLKIASRYLHRFMRTAEAIEDRAKGWSMVANIMRLRGSVARAEYLTHALLKKNATDQVRAIDGILYLVLGNLEEKKRDYEAALACYQKAHACFMGEHNWYYHLYVLVNYARVSRLTRQYSQAYGYLDLVEKAASGAEFGLLRREVTSEKLRLEQDAVDLLIDSRKCVIRTREAGSIPLGKQYVLLHILEALHDAHDRTASDMERGLSKAEIIEKVWREPYRPESHDNKLYYNINRLRKLIEPDIRKPKYLLNWKEGYRLAPGLKIHFIGGGASH